MTLLAKNNNGMHNLFRMSSLASLEGYYFKPRMDRELLQTYGQGLIATTGLPVRRGPDPAAARPVRGGASRPPPSSATSSAPRTSSASSWTTASTSSARSRRTCCGSPRTSASRWWPPTTCTTPSPRTPRPTPRCCASSPARRSWTPTGSSSTPTDFYLKTPGRDAHTSGASCPRPATTPCSSPSAATSRSPRARAATCRASPAREGENEESWFVKEVERGLHDRFPEGVPDYARKQADVRDRRHRAARATPGYFLVVADFINWAKNNGIRVGPGRGSGAGSMCAYAMGSPTSTRSRTA